jgi:hypothetical protein
MGARDRGARDRAPCVPTRSPRPSGTPQVLMTVRPGGTQRGSQQEPDAYRKRRLPARFIDAPFGLEMPHGLNDWRNDKGGQNCVETVARLAQQPASSHSLKA